MTHTIKETKADNTLVPDTIVWQCRTCKFMINNAEYQAVRFNYACLRCVKHQLIGLPNTLSDFKPIFQLPINTEVVPEMPKNVIIYQKEFDIT